MLFKPTLLFLALVLGFVGSLPPDVDLLKEVPPICKVPGSSQINPECTPSTNPASTTNSKTSTLETTKSTTATSSPMTTQPSNQDSNGVSISYEEFNKAVSSNGGEASQDKYQIYMSQMSRGRINTKEEAAMLLAHSIHETGGLKKLREELCMKDMQKCRDAYKNNCDYKDKVYYGRGYLQLTWCYNYKPASQDIFTDLRLYENPELAADDQFTAWATAFWYWGKNVHDFGGSTFEFGKTTNAINGKLECNGADQTQARNRFEIYKKVRQVYGLAGQPNERGCYN